VIKKKQINSLKIETAIITTNLIKLRKRFKILRIFTIFKIQSKNFEMEDVNEKDIVHTKYQNRTNEIIKIQEDDKRITSNVPTTLNTLNNNSNLTSLLNSHFQTKNNRPNNSNEMISYLSNRNYNNKNNTDLTDFANSFNKPTGTLFTSYYYIAKINEVESLNYNNKTSSKNNQTKEIINFKIEDIKSLSKQLQHLNDEKIKCLGQE